MNTETTRTEAVDKKANRDKSKKVERDPNKVYKNDRIDVWATGANKNTAPGTHKSMHPILAAKLVDKGFYSYEEVAAEGGAKKNKKGKASE